MKNKFSMLAPLALAILMASGCALKPSSSATHIELPASYRAASLSTDALVADYQDWSSQYNDAVLSELLAMATDNTHGSNLDIAKAYTQFEQASIAVKSARSSLWPTLGVGSTSSKTGQHSNEVYSKAQAHSVSAIARYEMDLWGKFSNTVASREFEAQGMSLAVEMVRKSVKGQVATQYWVLRQVEAEMAFMREQIQARTTQVQINQNKLRYGTGTELEVKQAEANLANFKRQLVALQAQRKSLEETLALLVGKPGLTIAAAPTSRTSDLVLSSQDTPSLMLANRSDIKQAEVRLESAGLDVAVARAAMFPSISFNAQSGYQNGSLSSLVQPTSSFWTLGYSLDLPLFDRGLRLSQIDQAKALERERVIDYRKAIQTAFHDVNQALIDLERLEATTLHLEQEVDAASAAYRMASLQYESGLIGYSQLLDAQQANDEAERSRVKLGFEKKIAQIAYLNALGF